MPKRSWLWHSYFPMPLNLSAHGHKRVGLAGINVLHTALLHMHSAHHETFHLVVSFHIISKIVTEQHTDQTADITSPKCVFEAWWKIVTKSKNIQKFRYFREHPVSVTPKHSRTYSLPRMRPCFSRSRLGATCAYPEWNIGLFWSYDKWAS